MRYSLRTLLIAITALGCFLGYELSWIRQRRQFLADHDLARQSHVSYSYGLLYTSEDVGRLGVTRKCPTAPGLLWLFGEKGVNVMVIDVPPELTGQQRQSVPELVATARRLFPESEINAP